MNITPKQKKQLGYAAIAIIAIAGIFYFKKKKSKLPPLDGQYTNMDAESMDMEAELPSMDLSFSDLANQVFNALDGCGDDFIAVETVFSQIKSAEDVQKLAEAFGTRVNTSCFITHPVDAMMGDNKTKVDLFKFLKNNLSYEQYTQIFEPY